MPTHQAQAEALFFDGNRCMDAGDVVGAEDCFKRALALNPDFSAALANIGWLRDQAGAKAEAETCYRQAISLDPGNTQTYLNLAVLLVHQKRFDEAESCNRRALELAPDSPAIWSNLGVLLACMKREEEAAHCYRIALGLDHNYVKARFNLSYVLLRQGHFAEGWRCLEARAQYVNLAAHFTCPRWNGELLQGKAILLGIEAGHGDMIQFCRYAPMLKAMGAARITVLCQPDLHTLFTTLPGVDEVLSCTADDIPTSDWDFWTPPMSIPLYCHTRLDNIPAPIPYLTADPAKIAQWLPALPASGLTGSGLTGSGLTGSGLTGSGLPGSGLRIGLVWKGNPLFENDADRSLPSLDALAPLASVTGVHFISLQKGAGEEEAAHPPAGFSLLNLGSVLQDFSDTAAVVASLDLVISVDTAVAHLAGSLGKPCWVLLPDYRTDWRWLTSRTDTPWYPDHMRLFRQAPGGDWQQVIAAVVVALECWKNEQENSD